MSVATRNLLQDKVRLLLSIVGIALAIMLILVLSGLLNGTYTQVSSYLEHTSGTVVVSQSGVKNLLGATSVLPPGTLEAAQHAQGVEVDKVVPIFSQFLILDLHGKKQPVYMVGYDPGLGGGPWRIVDGREPQAQGEVVFDSVLAHRHDIMLGDKVHVTGQEFTVVGLSGDTASWMTSFFFMRKVDAERLFRSPGATSFLLVTLGSGTDPIQLRDRLNNLPLSGANAVLKSDLIANDRKLFARFFSAPLQLMVVVAFLVGVMVVGLVIYTATVERQREYGVLRAIGARNSLLYRVVVTQAVIAAGAGSALGVGFALGAAQIIMAMRPQFLVTLEPAAIGWSLLLGLAMALLAALFPARVMSALAPAEVFRR